MAAVLMAVDTDHASLLVNICGQIVGFHTVWSGNGFAFDIGGSVFPVIIMLIATIVIAAHIVAVVAAQALSISGGTKGMGLQFPARKGEMAGATTCAVGNRRILVTRGINMAAQAAAAEHVVGQCERGCNRSGDRDVNWCCQVILCAKMYPDRVDFFTEGEVEGMRRIGYLPGMACAAGSFHVHWVGRFSYQAGVGFIDIPFIIEAAMTGGAGQIVGRIELDHFMATCAARWFGCDRYRLDSRSFLRFWGSDILGTATAEQQENNE